MGDSVIFFATRVNTLRHKVSLAKPCRNLRLKQGKAKPRDIMDDEKQCPGKCRGGAEDSPGPVGGLSAREVIISSCAPRQELRGEGMDVNTDAMMSRTYTLPTMWMNKFFWMNEYEACC
eukprot:1137994-Pelagomonas_calceolata.AAC.6